MAKIMMNTYVLGLSRYLNYFWHKTHFLLEWSHLTDFTPIKQVVAQDRIYYMSYKLIHHTKHHLTCNVFVNPRGTLDKLDDYSMAQFCIRGPEIDYRVKRWNIVYDGNWQGNENGDAIQFWTISWKFCSSRNSEMKLEFPKGKKTRHNDSLTY